MRTSSMAPLTKSTLPPFHFARPMTVWPVAFHGDENAVVPWRAPLTYSAMVWALLS
jgi:hypothetical protein